MKLALQGLTDQALCAHVPGLEPGHARKLLADVHRDRPMCARTGVPKRAIELVTAAGEQPALQLVDEQHSKVDPFRKYVFATPAGDRIETVRIPLAQADRFSVCVSSQVGCALACGFCATGRMGLRRNLAAWEIVEQVRQVRRRIPPGSRVNGVVFQGMGEAMANLDQVLAAIDVMCAPYTLAIDARCITVSTAGLPAGIRRLAREAPRVRLAISIGSAIASVRERIMPITRAHALAEVIDAAVDHAAETGLAPMWAVTLLRGVNDGDEHARALVALADDYRARTGRSPRVSVIAYNAIDHSGDDPFQRSEPERVAAFRDVLSAAGLRSSRRYSGGWDIGAACGQLVELR